MMEEDTGNDFPAVNNITVRGYLPSDQVPSPGKIPVVYQFSKIQILARGPLQVTEVVSQVL